MAVSDIKRLIPNEGAPRNDHTMNRLSYSPVAINLVVMVISDGLRSTLIVENFPWGACLQIPLERCVLYVCKNLRAARAAWPHQPHILCAPPLDPPLSMSESLEESFVSQGSHSCLGKNVWGITHV